MSHTHVNDQGKIQQTNFKSYALIEHKMVDLMGIFTSQLYGYSIGTSKFFRCSLTSVLHT